MKKLKFKLLILFICQPLDGILTYLGIQRANGLHVEGNPILVWLMENSSSEGLMLFLTKLLACIFILFLYLTLKNLETTKLFSFAINICLLAYIYVVVSWIYVLTFGVLS